MNPPQIEGAESGASFDNSALQPPLAVVEPTNTAYAEST